MIVINISETSLYDKYTHIIRLGFISCKAMQKLFLFNIMTFRISLLSRERIARKLIILFTHEKKRKYQDTSQKTDNYA